MILCFETSQSGDSGAQKKRSPSLDFWGVINSNYIADNRKHLLPLARCILPRSPAPSPKSLAKTSQSVSGKVSLLEAPAQVTSPPFLSPFPPAKRLHAALPPTCQHTPALPLRRISSYTFIPHRPAGSPAVSDSRFLFSSHLSL